MTQPSLIGQRYQLQEQLGAGAMGRVFRAHDRLNDTMVALKQVLVAPADLQFASRPSENDPAGLLLALAHEFRLLASLRHPHIISVLDYGFDALQQPFFTMELLHASQMLLAAGQDQALAGRVELLIQLLQALAYLHQRGILHHDLKPDNVLVSAGQVRVLDFGLAVAHDQLRTADSFGTLLYLAPEVLAGESYTVASDLYAVGVIAYELLVGIHPFAAATVSALLDRVIESELDITPLADHPALAAVLVQLLAKRPDQRFASASAAIAALYAALGIAIPPESLLIRESFLQAATFVGRTAELTQLRTSMAQTVAGQGSAWLVAGESGVGKSRLLEELRAEALVVGALVLRGQAVAEGGLPYQLWRAPLRHLALSTPLDDHAASLIQELVPDLARLLGRSLPVAPPLDASARHQQLIAIVIDMIRRQPLPLVLLLEDLHWSDESLTLLASVAQQIGAHRLLIVGSYRDDERPQLPEIVPEAQVLKLARLDSDELAALSVAMLGSAGEQPEVLALLARETEGNAFFTVEVVRALAEEAGGLSQIGSGPLPMQVVAGGVQQLIGRRLARVPERARALLTHAAVVGRQLDRAVLEALVRAQPALWPTVTVTTWLQLGADAAVLELANEQWQFAHDKLREGVLAQIADTARPAIHAAVAQAIEAAYPAESERATYAEPLMQHWRQAGDAVRELVYLELVVARMVDVAAAYAQSQAISLHGLDVLAAIDLPGAAQKRMRMLDRLGEVATYLGDHAVAEEHLLAGLALARTQSDLAAQLGIHLRLARLRGRMGEYGLMRTHSEDALALAQQIGDQAGVARAFNLLGNRAYYQSDYPASELHLQQARAIYIALGHQPGHAATSNDLGLAAVAQGRYQEAQQYFTQASACYHAIGSTFGRGLVLMNQGSLLIMRGALHVAQTALEESLAICEAMQVPHLIGSILILRGRLYSAAGDYAGARVQVERGVTLLRTHTIKQDLTFGIVALSLIEWHLGQQAAAHALAAEALAHALAAGELHEASFAQYVLGLVAASAGDHAAAQAHLTQSITISRAINNPELVMRGLHARGQLAYDIGSLASASTDLSESIALARDGDLAPQLAASLAVLAPVQAALDQTEAAQHSLHEAAALAQASEIDSLKLVVLLSAAQLAQRTSYASISAQLATSVATHPAADAATGARAALLSGNEPAAIDPTPTLDSILGTLIGAPHVCRSE